MQTRWLRPGVHSSASRGERQLRICMFVYNACTHDARVLREADTLSQAGHDVRIIAVYDGKAARSEKRGGIRIHRIERDPPHYWALRGLRHIYRLLRLSRAAPREAARRSLITIQRAERELVDFQRHRRGLGWIALPSALVLAAPLLALRLLLRPLQRLAAPHARVAMEQEENLDAIRRLDQFLRGALLRVHKPLMFLDFYIRAKRLMRIEPADVYHAHDLNTLVVAAWAARDGGRVVFDAHELYPEISTLSERERRIWRRLERRLIARADRVLTVCDSIADALAHRYGVERPTVLLNCPPRPEAPLSAVGALRRKVGLESSDEPIVLYHGGFVPNRGLPALLRATAMLDRGILVLMGWGRLEPELRAIVAHEHLSDRVRFTGPVEQSELLIYAADAAVGVIPYEPVGLNNTYTTPNKLFDYLNVGVPIAASRLPELVRFVETLGTGVIFDRAEPAAIAAAVNGILGDAAAARAMRDTALQASVRLCWEHESAKLLQIYAGLR